MAFSIPPERAVRESVAAILRRVAAAAEAAGVEYVVGGALARDLLLFHVFGQQTTRASRDVDVMVLVPDWPVFDALKTWLVATGEFTAVPGVHQRLLHGASGTPLDLVPFGGVEEPAGSVAWPPARDVVMSVVGFEEASRDGDSSKTKSCGRQSVSTRLLCRVARATCWPASGASWPPRLISPYRSERNALIWSYDKEKALSA